MRRNWLELVIVLTVAALAMASLRQELQPPPETDAEALRHYNRGTALAQEAEFGKAIGEFSQALALKPDYLKAYRARGRAWAASGARDRALADYTNGLDRAQGAWDVWIHQDAVGGMYLDRARLHLVEGRFEEALADAERIFTPDHMYAAQDVAACAEAGLDRWAEAKERLGQQREYLGIWEGSSADPYDEERLNLRLKLQVTQDEAEQQKLQDRLNVISEDWSCLVHLAGVEAHLGNGREALKVLEEWKSHGSPSPHGPEGPCLLCKGSPHKAALR